MRRALPGRFLQRRRWSEGPPRRVGGGAGYLRFTSTDRLHA